MPGPVSDSYDPEFSTGENAREVRDGLNDVLGVIEAVPGLLTPDLKYIVDVARGVDQFRTPVHLSERQAQPNTQPPSILPMRPSNPSGSVSMDLPRSC